MNIPDPIERGEARCEEWEAQYVKGDEFLCQCGRTAKLSEAETLSPDPYAIPVCGECFAEWCHSKGVEVP